MVPSTSGWPAWPISTRVRPRLTYLRPWAWTLETSGQVASITGSSRALAASTTERATPCALNTVTAPRGTW